VVTSTEVDMQYYCTEVGSIILLLRFIRSKKLLVEVPNKLVLYLEGNYYYLEHNNTVVGVTSQYNTVFVWPFCMK
jgi:hypothetical protein